MVMVMIMAIVLVIIVMVMVIYIYIEWIRMVHPGPLLGWFCELRGPEGRLFLSHFVAIKTSAEDIEMSNSG